ncbi:MAG TPA: hypothetical protein VF608_04725, partial [Thermoanaerobaculia bacterium]
MNHDEKKLKKHFEKRLRPEELKERKRAGKLRKALDKGSDSVRGGRVTEDNWEALIDQHGHSRRRPMLSELLAHLEHDASLPPPEDGELEGAA